MPTYAYNAIELATGRDRQGSVAGRSQGLAAAELKAQGLAVTSLSPDTSGSAAARRSGGSGDPGIVPRLRRRSLWRGRMARRKTLALFTRQLTTLVTAGMPLLRALEVLVRQEENQPFQTIIEGLAETIRSGGNLSDGLRLYPQAFDRLYVDMVKAGEVGGVLGTVLEYLALFLERTERIKRRVRTAMAYPVIILLVASAVLAGLMIFVVPKFEQIFAGMLKGQPLPPLTRAVFGAGSFAGQHLVAAAGIAMGIGLALAVFRKSRPGNRQLDGLLIRLPVLGDLLLKAAIARFSRTFGSLLASGVPMLDALVITRDTSGNACVAEALQTVHDRVREGATVAGPLGATSVFPRLVTGLIEVGEETGALPPMLRRIADTYDEEVDQAVAALAATIEPIMIVLMAAGVGVIVLALFLPMVSLIQHLQ